MKRIIFIFTIILIQSCVFIRMDDSIDLGNNYRFIQDSPKTIIFHQTEEYEGVGIEVIPPVVLNYSFNEKYIIAKTQEVNNMTGKKIENSFHYWIIDKENKQVKINSMNLVTFENILNNKNIKLELN